jgi:hypothetical protein
MYGGDLPECQVTRILHQLNFQPSLPIPLAKGVNLFVRPLIPIIISQPYYGDNGFANKRVLI